jgi:hypothetical protein
MKTKSISTYNTIQTDKTFGYNMREGPPIEIDDG